LPVLNASTRAAGAGDLLAVAAGWFRVGGGTDRHPHLSLHVPLDRRLARAPVRLSPDHAPSRPLLGILRAHRRQREHPLLVRGEASPHGEADDFSSIVEDSVVHPSRVLGQGEIEVLGALALGVRDETADDARGLVRIPDQRHLLAVWLVREPLAGGSADEVVIELEQATIPQIPRGQVVVFDPGTDETSTQRADRFVGRRGEPPPVGLERRTGGDRRQRMGNPAGFEPVRCLGARANLP
jgi:hypothetical protein